jgi:predicted nucleic acid-binding protein
MVYADTDFFLALVKEDDWLKKNAEELLEENTVETSLITFVELALVENRFDFNLENSVTEIMEMAEVDFEEKVVYQALEYIDQGLNVFDAFQAAKSNGKIISSDKEFDKTNIERMKLEEMEDE